MAAKGLGFTRDMVLAAVYGASRETDGFFLVFSLWVQVAVTVAGSCVQVFVPRWLAAQEKGGEAATASLLGSTLLTFGGVLSAIAALAFWAAPQLVGLIAPEFDDAARAVTAALLRDAAPVLPLCGIAGVIVALAHARGHFFLVKVASLGMNVGILVGLALFERTLGIRAAAIGCSLGALTMVATTAIYLPRERIPLRLAMPGRAGLAILAGVVGLTVLGHSGGYLMSIVTRAAYSALPAGQLTCLGYAAAVVGVPVQMIQFAVLTTMIAALSAHVAARRLAEAEQMGHNVLRTLLFLLVPMILILVVLREPAMRLLFLRGAFTPEDAHLSALLLACLAPATLFALARNVIATAWYAHGLVWAPNAIGLVGVAAFLAASGPAASWGGAWGLSLLQSAVSLLTLAVLAAASPAAIGIRWTPVGVYAARIVLGSVPALAFAAGIAYLGTALELGSTLGSAAVLGIGGAGGLALYVASAQRAGLGQELGLIKAMLARRTAR